MLIEKIKSVFGTAHVTHEHLRVIIHKDLK